MKHWEKAVVDLVEIAEEVFGAQSEPSISVDPDKQLVVSVSYRGQRQRITIVEPDLCYEADEQLAFFKTAKAMFDGMRNEPSPVALRQAKSPAVSGRAS